MFNRLIFAIFCLFLCITSHADQLYYLCGPDEDGCSPEMYPYCLCMPHDGVLATQPYCLDLDTISCKPLSLSPQCTPDSIYKDQATCLAVAFQSEPEPPCSLVTQSFCQHNRIPLCDRDGGRDSCR